MGTEPQLWQGGLPAVCRAPPRWPLPGSISWVQKKTQTEESCGIVRTLGANSRWKRGLTEAQSSQLPPSAPQTEWVLWLAAHSSLLLAACIADSILLALGRGKVFFPTQMLRWESCFLCLAPQT